MKKGQVTTVLLETPEMLGGVYLALDQAWQNADYRDVLADDVVPCLAGIHEDYFNTEAGPEGSWPALSQRTIDRKGFDTILVENNNMRSSLLFDGASDHIEDIEARFLVWGTDDPKALFHQEGTKNMPARPFVGLRPEHVDKIVEMVADAAVELLKG